MRIVPFSLGQPASLSRQLQEHVFSSLRRSHLNGSHWCGNTNISGSKSNDIRDVPTKQDNSMLMCRILRALHYVQRPLQLIVSNSLPKPQGLVSCVVSHPRDHPPEVPPFGPPHVCFSVTKLGARARCHRRHF